MKFYGLLIGLLAASGLSACAYDRPPPGPPPGPRGPQLFISPAGEPFRPDGPGPAPLRRWFDQADANHDGVLTPAEFEADQLRFFALADANQDGVITAPEVSRYETEIAPEILAANERPDLALREDAPEPGDISRIPGGRGGGMPGGGPGGGGPGGGRGGPGGGRGGMMGQGAPSQRGAGFVGQARQGAARYSLLNEPEPLRAADLDYDFKVTRAEWATASARRFAQLDAAKDGKLAFEELHLPGPQGGGRRGRARR